MPIITEDNQFKQIFLENLQKRYSVQKDGFFVTDLCGYCLRKSYWRRVKPKAPDEKTLGYYCDGIARHEALQDLAGFQTEVSVQKYGLRGRIDMLGEWPIEIKSTRSTRTEEINEHYLKQLIIYCLMTGNDTGVLMVQYINAGCWKFHRITFTPQELEQAEERLLHQLQLLKHALSINNPENVPYPPSWECKNCLYHQECFRLEKL